MSPDSPVKTLDKSCEMWRKLKVCIVFFLACIRIDSENVNHCCHYSKNMLKVWGGSRGVQGVRLNP